MIQFSDTTPFWFKEMVWRGRDWSKVKISLKKTQTVREAIIAICIRYKIEYPGSYHLGGKTRNGVFIMNHTATEF